MHSHSPFPSITVTLLGLAVALALAGGCSHQPEGNTSSSGMPASSAANATPPAFQDVSDKAGIHFLHQSSPTAHKYLVETMGSGGAFLDYDNDGNLDILLLNN